MASPRAPPHGGGICPFKLLCLCSWRKRCSPGIPIVAPGRDYACLPATGEDRAAWSLLVGFVSSSDTSDALTLHRFRVAQSGRILGRSDDTLEVLDYKAEESTSSPHICGATAMPSSDGSSLCLFSSQMWVDSDHLTVKLCPLQLQLDLNPEKWRVTVSTLPEVPLDPLIRTRPISAAGHLWAPCFSEHLGTPRLLMKRLDGDAGRWVDVAATELPIERGEQIGGWAGRFLHGYAVVDRTILLSLQQPVLFVAFDCSTGSWDHVLTTTKTSWDSDYLPIRERGVYVEEDNMIYFLYGSTLYAYKLCQDQDHKYQMEPPIKVDCLCPLAEEEGYGYVTHLGGRVMCSVWIGVLIRCICNTKHVLITTFRVEGNSMGSHGHFFPKGIKIIHSTCRRLDITPHKPSESHCEFCFLQEYADTDFENLMLLEGMEITTSSHTVMSSSMLACCRKFLNGAPLAAPLMLKDSCIQINRALYIICQTSSCSTVYKVNIMDGRLMCLYKTLTPLGVLDTVVRGDDAYVMMERPLAWHFFCSNNHIYAVSCVGNEIYRYNLHSGSISHSSFERPPEDSIALVLQVGREAVAISDTFQCVYRVAHRGRWMRIDTHRPTGMRSKVNLSGYVLLGDNIIMVSDANTTCWYWLDMRFNEWRSVQRHWSESDREILSGRSVFVDGFVYTCTDGGLAAFKVMEYGGVYSLGRCIYLKFLWRKYWESCRMCLDYVGKDSISGDNIFCVVQGDYNSRPRENPLCITTVQVASAQRLEPIQVIGHVDFVTSFVGQKGVIWTSNCFAVDP